MRFSVLAGAVLTGLPSAMADQRSWELVTGVCNTGFGEGGSWPWRLVKLAGTSGCSGCDLWNVQTNMWKSPNPCKRCNSGDIFDYVKNGSGMNVVRTYYRVPFCPIRLCVLSGRERILLTP